MAAGKTLENLESVIKLLQQAHEEFSKIETPSDNGRKRDLLDDTKMSLVWAMNKLIQLRIIAISEEQM
jgi:hypothetical protein